jgi:hypothetical protein
MLLTVTAFEGTSGSPDVDVVPAVTVMVTSVTHEEPCSPHAFTCKVCVPEADPTEVSMEAPSMVVVSALLSNE